MCKFKNFLKRVFNGMFNSVSSDMVRNYDICISEKDVDEIEEQFIECIIPTIES